MEKKCLHEWMFVDVKRSEYFSDRYVFFCKLCLEREERREGKNGIGMFSLRNRIKK